MIIRDHLLRTDFQFGMVCAFFIIMPLGMPTTQIVELLRVVREAQMTGKSGDSNP